MVVGLFVYQQLFGFQIKMFQILLLRTHPDYPLPLGRRACPVVALTPWMRLFGHTDLTPSSEKIN